MLFRTLAALALVLRAQSVVAQVPDYRTRPLRGLSSLHVVVEGISDAGTAGVDTVGLRVQVELELRRTGIVVSDTAEPFLYLNVNLISSDGATYAYSYDMQLNDWVNLARRPRSAGFFAITWSKGGVGTAAQARVAAAIQEAVRSLTQVFLNDYLAANPPRR